MSTGSNHHATDVLERLRVDAELVERMGITALPPVQWFTDAKKALEVVDTRKLAADLREAADEIEQLRDALGWLVNVLNDVGKAGGRPEPQEFEAAHTHARHTLDGGGDR